MKAWVAAVPLLVCALLALQGVQAWRVVRNHAERTAGPGGQPPFALVVVRAGEAEAEPDMVALADSILALEDAPGQALTAEQRGRLLPLVDGLHEAAVRVADARTRILEALTPQQVACLAAPPPPDFRPPPVPRAGSPEEALARRLLGALAPAPAPGLPVELHPDAARRLAARHPLAVLEALDRELPRLGLSPAQVETLRAELQLVLEAEERRTWLKDRVREVFRPRQLVWLERRGLASAAPYPSPLRPLVREWLRTRAEDRS